MRKWAFGALFLFFGFALAWTADRLPMRHNVSQPAVAAAKPASPPRAGRRGCSDFLREVKRLFAARDPGLLRVNILDKGCGDAQLYEAAYYQGFAYYFLGRHQDALVNLDLARSLSGAWDEQILYYIWKLQVQIGDLAGQERTFRDFREAYPGSKHRQEMEQTSRQILVTQFSGIFSQGFMHSAGNRSFQGPKSRSFLNAAYSQEKGYQQFSEYLEVAGNFSLDEREQHYFGISGGAEYRVRDFGIQLELGRSRSIYPVDTAGADSVAHLLVRKWEWQRSLAATQSYRFSPAWSLQGALNYYQSGSSFASYGVGGELERSLSRTRVALQVREEFQEYALEAGCLDLDQGYAQCGSSRLLATETDLDATFRAGRHSWGSTGRVRVEVSLDSTRSRRWIAVAGAQYGIRFLQTLKLSNRLDWGGEWEERGFVPVRRYGVSLLAYF